MIRNVATSTEFQDALDACVAGDIIKLDYTKTFEGAFVLRNRGVIPDNNRILITSSADPSKLPGPGRRIQPIHFPFLPKIRGVQASNYKFVPSISTASAANGYILRWLEVQPQYSGGGGDQIGIGYNDSKQTEYSQIPYNITIDQCYIHGSPINGQKRGINWNGDNVKITNNYMTDHLGQGQDSMCIGGGNCRGPLLVENNLLEGGTYSFITAGDDFKIRTIATVLSSPAPTNSGCRLSTTKDLSVGQLVAILWNDGTTDRRKHPYVTSVNHTTGDITYASIGVTPSIPGDVRWGTQPKDITFRRNHCTKKLEWMNPVMGTPVESVSTSAASTGLVAGTYYYRMVAIRAGYEFLSAYGAYTPERTVTLSTTSRVTLNWSAVPTAEKYRIYRYQKDAAGAIINRVYFETVNLTFTDNGTGGTAGGFHSTTNGIKWVVKNIFELKTGVNVLVENNIMENCWRGSDVGESMWLKNNNQGGGHQFSQCHDVTFKNNLWRHVSGWHSNSGVRSSSNQPDDYVERPFNFTFDNNLVYDSGEPWTQGGNIYAFDLSGGTHDVTYNHNTVIHTKYGMVRLIASNKLGYLDNHTWKNSLYVKNTYGIKGGDDAINGGMGKQVLDAHCPGYVFQKNVIGGATSSLYDDLIPAPYNNIMPDMTTFQAQFKNYGGPNIADYKLKRVSEGDSVDSDWLNIATDGKDLGCDIPTLESKIAGVITGDPEGSVTPDEPPPPPPPSSSNLQTLAISFASPAVLGDQYIECGFAPKAIIFMWNRLTADGEGDDAKFGIGVDCIDGTKWSGYLGSDDAVASSRNVYVYSKTNSVNIVSSSISTLRAGSVRLYGQTGFTFDWREVDPELHIISALVLGGDGLTDCTAFDFAAQPAVGSQAVNVGFQPTTVLFFTPTNSTNAVPALGTKNSSMFFGVAVSPTEQAAISERIKNLSNPSSAHRKHNAAACIESVDDTGILRTAALTAFTSTGFTLNYTAVNNSSDRLFGLALKGPRAKLIKITEPAAGQVVYNVGFKPEAILSFGAGLASPGSYSTHSRLVFGAASGVGNRFSISAGARDAVTPTIAKSRLSRDKFYQRSVEGSAPVVEADVAAISSTGFTGSYSGSSSGSDFFVLALGAAPTGGVVTPPALLEATVLLTTDVQADLEAFVLLAASIDIAMEVLASLTTFRAVFHSIVGFFSLRVNLDVKREVDSGEVQCFAADAGGTVVNFNKAFKDVDSITLAVAGSAPRTAIYDFVDAPSPTTFKILVFDNTGARVNGKVSWKARGIV
jgi:hypothetical protein